jgi:hypothetical protein
MIALQDFDRVLAVSSTADSDAWGNDGAVLVGTLAAKLSAEELTLLRVLWTDRPLLWQRRCAEVLGSARLDEAIELLMDMVDQGKPEVALAALESLREFHPRRFTPEQMARVLAALHTTLEGPVGPLHRVVLEAFLATLRAAGAAE